MAKRYNFLLLLYLLISKVLCVERPFVSKFHQPNDFDINGESCMLRYPTISRSCPIFGIYSDNLKNEEIEYRCSEYGFKCEDPNEHLFIDGSCRECPQGMIFAEDGKNVYCQDPENTSITAYKNLINPFNCLSENPLVIPREINNSYRPCYNESSRYQVEIDNYSSSNDLSNILTLTTCAEQLEKDLQHSTLEINSVEQTIPFSTIGSMNTIYAQAGYLQCSVNSVSANNFFTPFWIALYSIYVFGVLYVVLFCIYKHVKENYLKIEAYKNSMSSTTSCDDSSDSFEDALFLKENDITQKGYIKTYFGRIAFFIFATLSFGLLLFLIVIILDIYGMHYKTFCKDNVAVQEACKIAIENGDDPNWRLGYLCASGCVFSLSSTRGNDPEWPFYAVPGGGPRIGIAFIVVWHIALVWYIYLRIIINKIGSFFYIRCDISIANYILITKPIEQEIISQNNSKSLIRIFFYNFDKLLNKIRGKPCHYKLCEIHNENSIRFFDFQCLRYCWNETIGQFQVSQFPINGTHQEILENNKNGLTDSVAVNRYNILGSNSIDIEIDSIFKAIFTEFFDYLYLYQLFTLLIWHYTNYWTVTIVTMFIILVSASVKIITRRKSQWKVKNMAHNYHNINVYRNGNWKTISSIYLVPGDLIKVTSTGGIPCDCILIDGRCVLDESSLTGEPTPVPKISLDPTSNQIYDNSQNNYKYTLFAGSYLQSFSPGHSSYTLAIVLATGASTSKGKLMKNLLFPPPISFTFEQHLNAVYIVLLLWSCVVMAIVIYFLEGVLSSWFLAIYSTSQIFTPLIPAVYVAALSQGAIHLSKKNIYCVNYQRMSVTGKIKIFCFDKTGTLTAPGLEFRGIQFYTTGSKKFEHFGIGQNFPEYVKILCGCCNELDFVPSEDGELTSVGNEVDVALFSSSGFKAEIKDSYTIMKLNEKKYRVLRRFEFDRATMTMSVIVENEFGEKFVFTKGSYEVISKIVEPSSLPHDYFQEANSLAKKGMYMLGMAYKPFIDEINESSTNSDGSLYNVEDLLNKYNGSHNSSVHTVKREDIESNLICLGLIKFENPMKHDTPSIINSLKEGDINTKILTGDNSLTASFIARASGISTAKQVLLGDVESNSENFIWKDFDSDQVCDSPLSFLPFLKSGKMEIAITGRLFVKLNSLRHKHQLSKPIQTDNSITKNQITINKDESLLDQILPYIRIYSRLTPDQKVLVIGEQMKIDLTGMCGDGANDLGALRLAHCGIAISAGTSEAGIVSHFSSPDGSLSVVLETLKEGRSTLSKAMGSFKALIVFGETKAILGIIQHYFAVAMSEFYWIAWDTLIYLGMSWCLLQSHPANRLYKTRPTAKMFGFETVFSVCSIIFINWCYTIGAILLLFSQNWFLCREFDANNINHLNWWLKGDNYETVVIAMISTFQFISAGPAFNLGFKYRAHWWKNHSMTIFVIFNLLFFSYLFLAGPTFLSCLFRTNCGDQSVFKFWKDNDIISDINIPSNAPLGCSCNDQFGFSDTCENEYINCTNSVFNSRFHHNYLSFNSRLKFYILGFANFLTVILWEYVVVFGPVRTYVKSKLNSYKLNKQ